MEGGVCMCVNTTGCPFPNFWGSHSDTNSPWIHETGLKKKIKQIKQVNMKVEAFRVLKLRPDNPLCFSDYKSHTCPVFRLQFCPLINTYLLVRAMATVAIQLTWAQHPSISPRGSLAHDHTFTSFSKGMEKTLQIGEGDCRHSKHPIMALRRGHRGKNESQFHHIAR